MKKHILGFMIIMLSAYCLKAQTIDTLKVYYYENYPYTFTENGEIKGLELEIMDEFINWMYKKKNISLTIVHRQYQDFNKFYTDVKTSGAKVIGMGSVAYSLEREKELAFSAPYLKNVSVLISEGTVESVKSKTKEDVTRVFAGMTAMVVKNASHEKHMGEIKTTYLPDLKITTTEKQDNVLNAIVADKKVLGYVDIVAYWSYLKKNPSKSLKIQKVFNAPNEMLSFVMPKNNVYAKYINEFFESGFGFTATKKYHQILENYLGHEIIDDVEIK